MQLNTSKHKCTFELSNLFIKKNLSRTSELFIGKGFLGFIVVWPRIAIF